MRVPFLHALLLSFPSSKRLFFRREKAEKEMKIIIASAAR